MTNIPIYLSLIIPLLNEEDNLHLLYQHLTETLGKLPYLYEIVFIDDGSIDQSPAILADLFEQDPDRVRVIRFRRNFGKTAALNAGFVHAKGC